MKVVFNIFFCVLIFFACANGGEQNQTLSTEKSAELIFEEQIEHSHSNTSTSTTKEESNSSENEHKAKPLPTTQVKYEEDSPKKGSTIAEQQEAARRIQNELARRSPMPDEDDVSEGAVFEKVVSNKNEKIIKPSEQPDALPTPIEKPAQKKSPTKKKTSNKAKKPAISFEELTMSFDTINQGDKFDHKFVFTNTGNAPLEIKSATATCGCTQPSYPFIPIEPNEQGYISVRYNSVGKEGHQKPEVSILTNIDKNEIVLYLEGFVIVEKEEEKEK